MTVHATPAIYNKRRFVRKVPNQDGFMDVDHAQHKPPNTIRIGFFGDSYVEALQVPLDETFFRLIPNELDGVKVETFGFGISGWGTLHSMLAYEAFAPMYDLDIIVYVFVENDLGDNSYTIEGRTSIAVNPKPWAELSGGDRGFEIRWNHPPTDAGSLPFRMLKLVQQRSLVAQLIWSRVELLRERGVAISRDRRADEMSETAGAVPHENDLASTWPPQYAEEAKTLAYRILAAWQDEVTRTGKPFLVLYVPRGNEQLDGSISITSTWYPWLVQTCATLRIPIVDPTPALRAVLESGHLAYDDHWTAAAHGAVAREVTAALTKMIESRSDAPRTSASAADPP